MSDRYLFYLSFPHSVPLIDQRPEDLDKWTRRLFADLSAEVRRLGPGLAPGFADHELDADWRAGLRCAEVFVPLYSPLYFARTRTTRELGTFRRRVTETGGWPDDQVVPVLWTRPPHTDDDSSWVRHCLALTGAPDSYTENGLQALLRLWMFRADYRRVIRLLAERIVDVSPAEPARPNMPPDPDAIAEPAAPASFAVIVAADPGWRPFSGEASLPAARYAARVAERLDFVVTVTTLEDADGLNSMPALVLIDGHDPGKPVDHLPPWAIPITIGGDPQPGLANSQTLDDFGRLLPFLIAGAQRHFVRLSAT